MNAMRAQCSVFLMFVFVDEYLRLCLQVCVNVYEGSQNVLIITEKPLSDIQRMLCA